MKTQSQTAAWIYYTTIVLASILILNLAGIILLMILRYSVSEILIVLGFIAGAGLARLLISPISREPID